MRELLEVVDTWGTHDRNLKVVRLLDKDDFDIEEYKETPEKYVDSNGRERPNISCRYAISLKKEVLKHLIDVMGVELIDFRGKEMYGKRKCMTPLTDDWYPSPQKIIVESCERLSYKGIPKTNKNRRQDRYDRIRLVVENDWFERKDELLDQKILELWKDFSRHILRVNNDFDESLQRAVGDLSVNEDWLKKNRGETGKALAKEIKKIENKLAKLKKRRRELDVELSNYDRDLLVDNLTGKKSDFSEETQERVRVIRNENRGKVADTRRRGLMI